MAAAVGLSREHHIISNLFFNVSFVHSCLVTEMFYMSCLCSEKLPWVVLRIVCFLPDVVRWNGLLSQLLYVPPILSFHNTPFHIAVKIRDIFTQWIYHAAITSISLCQYRMWSPRCLQCISNSILILYNYIYVFLKKSVRFPGFPVSG